MFLTINDFIGFYKVSGNSHTQSELQTYIDNGEPRYLMELLGVELYNLFIADLNPNFTPQSQRFLDIFNPFSYDDDCGIVVSDGLIEMLKGFVYYDYVRDSDFFNTISGNVKHNYSNSSKARTVEYGLAERYNRALSTYIAIQDYIIKNSQTYPEYNGQAKDVLIWL